MNRGAGGADNTDGILASIAVDQTLENDVAVVDGDGVITSCTANGAVGADSGGFDEVITLAIQLNGDGVIAFAAVHLGGGDVLSLSGDLNQVLAAKQVHVQGVRAAADGEFVVLFCRSGGVECDTIQQDGSQGSVIRLSVRLKA